MDWRARAPGRLNTPIQLSCGARLRMVEHLLSALSAFGVDNAEIEVEGRELPVGDGSARLWTDGLAAAGLAPQSEPRRVLRILRPVQTRLTAGFVRFEPADFFSLDVTCPGRPGEPAQAWRGVPDRDTYLREIAPSRSTSDFIKVLTELAIRDSRLRPWLMWLDRRRMAATSREGFNRPHEDLVSGIAPEIMARLAVDRPEHVLSRGARPSRMAILVGPWTIGGARFRDERVRHHVLDLIGDLALAGAPILGRVVAHVPTHNLNFAALATLMATPDAWTWSVPDVA